MPGMGHDVRSGHSIDLRRFYQSIVQDGDSARKTEVLTLRRLYRSGWTGAQSCIVHTMRYWPLLVIALTAGCSEPLYDTTEPGARLTDWKHVGEVTNESELSTLSLTTSSGVKLRIEASRAISSGRQVPARIVVTLEENPVSAEVSVACRPPSHFDGDPVDVLTAMCMVAEQNGTESFLGTKESHQDVSTLRVKGNGSISL